MTQYPMDITEEMDFVPQIGDKIERTNREDGTVVIGVIAKQSNGWWSTSSGYGIYGPSCLHSQWSFRLLSRKPAEIKVGDRIESERLNELPPGSIATVYSGLLEYDVVVLPDGPNYPIRRITTNAADQINSWPILRKRWAVVRYINRH